MEIIVVATDEEYKLAKKRFKRHIIIKTGVGSINVIQRLKHIPRCLKIINFGYAGSNKIPIGTEVIVGECRLYHPNAIYDEDEFILDKESTIKCFTNNDFVLDTKITKPCVFDMELAYICALGFKKIKSIKIVSDNLSLDQYEKEIKNDRKSKPKPPRQSG